MCQFIGVTNLFILLAGAELVSPTHGTQTENVNKTDKNDDSTQYRRLQMLVTVLTSLTHSTFT